MDLKKTCLHDRHLKLNAKMTEFGGFDMPVSYKGILDEHKAVREASGLFDCSHMGEILLKGNDSIMFLNYVSTNDFSNLPNLSLQYTLILEKSGGVVDDLMVYKISDTEWLLVVNASNTEKDYKWLVGLKDAFHITLENVSGFYGQLALQGPKAVDVLNQIIPGVDQLKFMMFNYFTFSGEQIIISRSGYTGEDGFEIYASNPVTVKLFDVLKDLSEPCGLGARDTLRFEAGLPLYGHEINGFITPLEAGLGYFCKLEKDFVGRDVLLAQKEQGLERRLIGLELLERNIARDGYIVYQGEQMVGYITTGYMIPNTNKALANAMIDSKLKIGTEVTVEIRNKRVKAVIRNRKFMEKKYIKGDK
jgi:aminomethyltransferase